VESSHRISSLVVTSVYRHRPCSQLRIILQGSSINQFIVSQNVAECIRKTGNGGLKSLTSLCLPPQVMKVSTSGGSKSNVRESGTTSNSPIRNRLHRLFYYRYEDILLGDKIHYLALFQTAIGSGFQRYGLEAYIRCQ
jgi:hypothetical protein